MKSSTLGQITANFCNPRSKPFPSSSVCPVDFSTSSRSTVTSVQEENFHYFIDAEAVEVFSDKSSNADTENSDRSKLVGVRSYVTNEYAGLLRSREYVLENAVSHHYRAIE